MSKASLCKIIYSDLKRFVVSKLTDPEVLYSIFVAQEPPISGYYGEDQPRGGVDPWTTDPARIHPDDDDFGEPSGMDLWPDDDKKKKWPKVDRELLRRIIQSKEPQLSIYQVRDEHRQQVITSTNHYGDIATFKMVDKQVIGMILVDPDPRTTGALALQVNVLGHNMGVEQRARLWMLEIRNIETTVLTVAGGFAGAQPTHSERYVIRAKEQARAEDLRLMLEEVIGGDRRMEEVGISAKKIKRIGEVADIFTFEI